MKRWKLYFAYSHLPPHLQAVSKPFHDLADRVWREYHEAQAFAQANNQLAQLKPVDSYEMRVAVSKLAQALRAWQDMRSNDAMRLIIEAKDCAVRAMIPDPPEPDAG